MKSFLTIILVLFASAALAQPLEEWVARYNGPADSLDCAEALALDPSGNIYVTGYSWGSGTHYDYATIKYDSDGNQLWVARYNGPGNGPDVAYALALDPSGNVCVTGYSYGSGTSSDYATIKYDSDGNQLWVARYNGPANDSDWGEALALDPSGNVYVTGYSTGSGTDYDYATIKYDQNGNQRWVARYNGPANGEDRAVAMALDASGNVYVTGRSYGSGTGEDYAIIKYDTNGNELWVARYNGPGNGQDRAEALTVDVSGNVYVTGCSYGSGTDYDYATIKYSQGAGVETGTSGNRLPKDLRLTCHPNPFNATTRIIYSLPETGQVCLDIYNLGGQLIETLVEGHQDVGEYGVIWDASGQASGVYFYKLTAGDFTEVRRMTLLK